MKKTIFLALAMSVMAAAAAQTTDTVIQFGDRLPYLYYWDTNWYDHYPISHPQDTDFPFGVAYYMYGTFVARPCLTSTPLKVIGIAGFPIIKRVFNIYDDFGMATTIDTTMEGRWPEYFRLYVKDGDSIRFAAQTRWDTVTPNKRLKFRMYNHRDVLLTMYEAYFDEPVIVDSLFFVGGTAYNNYDIQIDSVYYELLNHYQYIYAPAHLRTYYHFLDAYHNLEGTHIYFQAPCIQEPQYLLYGYVNIREDHVNHHDTSSFYLDSVRYGRQVPIFFAIFDTSFVYIDKDSLDGVEPCLPPTGFHLEALDATTATLAWNHRDSTLWQLQLFYADSVPDSSDYIATLSVNMAVLQNLDTGTTYAARLRTVCGTDSASTWTDTIQFRLPQTTDDTTHHDDPVALDSPVDTYTQLFPNPANKSLTVISSFRLRKVELFSADGRLLISLPVNGVSATIDISDLLPATYIVRVTTPAGVTTKRLVKK